VGVGCCGGGGGGGGGGGAGGRRGATGQSGWPVAGLFRCSASDLAELYKYYLGPVCSVGLGV
jgi:hypothetical protein